MEQRPPCPTATRAAAEERASQQAESVVGLREQHWSTLEDAAAVRPGRTRDLEPWRTRVSPEERLAKGPRDARSARVAAGKVRRGDKATQR